MSELAAAVVGTFLWSLVEYVLHRFLGHDRRTMPNFFSVEHTRHHGVGDYFAPSWKKGLAATVVATVVFAASVVLVATPVAAAFTGGFTGMYLAYELLHRRAHTHAGIGPYGRWLRRHHFHHHFGNPRANHGVTSPLWDLAFGTRERATEIRVPRKLAMCWLVDPSTQGLRAGLDPAYRIVG